MADLFASPTIRCLSLWQPWASLWLVTPRVKLNETRHWRYPLARIDERIVVHAAQRRCSADDIGADLAGVCAEVFGADWRARLTYGAALGTIRLGHPVSTNQAQPATAADEAAGNWSPDRFAFPGHDPQLFAQPVPMKGRQGWWSVERAGLGL